MSSWASELRQEEEEMGRLFAEDICDRDNQVQPDFCYVAGVGKGMDPVVRHTGSPDILLSVHNTPITNKVLKLVRATSFTEPREEYWAVGARALPSGVDDGASGSRSLSDTLVSSEVHSPGVLDNACWAGPTFQATGLADLLCKTKPDISSGSDADTLADEEDHTALLSKPGLQQLRMSDNYLPTVVSRDAAFINASTLEQGLTDLRVDRNPTRPLHRSIACITLVLCTGTTVGIVLASGRLRDIVDFTKHTCALSDASATERHGF
ncbi:hypothetical protein H2203_008198 [Taxawa tesnikishii (nom. ined.)]|nr:hypothetical protein H2203_008198 [Dothideales sp. JES 119]